jgi:hypothetical protein
MNEKQLIQYMWRHHQKWDAVISIAQGPFITLYAYGVHYLRRTAHWVLDRTATARDR